MGKILDFNRVLMLLKSLFKPHYALMIEGFLKFISIFLVILGVKSHNIWAYVIMFWYHLL